MPRSALLLILVCIFLFSLQGTQDESTTPSSYANHDVGVRAIFAGGSCSGSCAINISGSGTTIVGGTHSNGCSAVPSDHTIPPPNSVVDPNSPRPISPAPDVVAPIPIPNYYSITQFDDPSDPFVVAAGANYYHLTGSVTLPSSSAGINRVTDDQMRNALIYVNGDVTLQANGFTFSSYKFTIVATGEIESSGSMANKTFSSYLNYAMGNQNYALLFFSNKNGLSSCTTGASGIYISTTDVSFQGGFYAPNSGIKLGGSNTYIFGYLAGFYIDLASSNSYYELNLNAVPPAYSSTHTPTPIKPTKSSTPCVNTGNPPNLIDPDHRTHTTDRNPIFRWSSVNNVQSYRFMIYLQDRSYVYKERLFTNTYFLPITLQRNTYQWRVRTQEKTCHTWSAWSQRNTLFID
jgi:hypothetical protein